MNDLSCGDCAELLGEYVEDQLAGDLRRAFDAHVAACGECARRLDEYRALPAVIRGATDVVMPYDVEVRLRRRLARAHRTRK